MGELINKVEGKIKQVHGDLTNDPVKHAEGVAQETKGKIQGKIADVKHAVKDLTGNK